MSYEITENCIGCTICAKHCPTGAITGTVKMRHEVNAALCIECGLCGKLCAKGAVLDPAGKQMKKIPKAQWKKPSISRADCVGCRVCVENCPVDCLEVEDAKFHGDIDTIARMIVGKEDECIGCGICSRVCPIDAIAF